MRNRITVILVIPMLCASAGAMAFRSAPRLTIVNKGKPAVHIRLSEKAGPVVRNQAEALSNIIERISGAKPALLSNDGPAIEIAVDETLQERLGEDGFVVRISVDGVQLHGATDIAVAYAVSAFMEEQLGCRWFLPCGELGTDIPQHSTITLKHFEKEYKPAMRFRSLSGLGRCEWGLRNRLSEGLKIGKKTYSKTWGGAHTFNRLVPITKYFKEHPEWFAFIDGKRQGPGKILRWGPQLCTSNPEVIKEVARKIGSIFDEDRRLMMVALGPTDALKFCECPACLKHDEPGREWQGGEKRGQWRGQLSRRLMLFYNEVAKLVKVSHPDKLIKVMVYSWYQEPPIDPNLKFEDNILVMLTHSGNPSKYESLYPSCYNHSLTDPRCRPNQERFVPALKGWRERSKFLGIYEYYYKVSVCETLFPIVHTIRKDIPYYHSQAVQYFYSQARATNTWFLGLNYYVTARLLWDIDTDVDALLSDFYARFYRKAEKPMRQYHELLENAMASKGGDVLGWLFHLPKVFDDATTARLRSLLEEADRLAESDTVVCQRIELAGKTLEYTLLAKKLWSELENEYRRLKSKTGAELSDDELAKKLTEHVKPFQEQLVNYIEGDKSLKWIKASGNGYMKTLIGPKIGGTYLWLLPAK